MLTELIIFREKAFETLIHPANSLETLLKSLLEKEIFSTSVLLFTEEGPRDEHLAKKPLPLFIFQNLPYAAYRQNQNNLEELCFSDYVKILSKKNGRLSLYQLSPVLFKSLLIIAQNEAVMRVTGDVINDQALIGRLEGGNQELVLTLNNVGLSSLYYFQEGQLRDGYTTASKKLGSPKDLRKKLLEQIVTSKAGPSDLALYEASIISGLVDQQDAVSQIAAAPSTENSPWREPGRTGHPEQSEDIKWGFEFLNSDKAGTIIPLTQTHYSLGRGKVNFRIDDPQISRHHANLEQSRGVLTLSDNLSTNGLFINDMKIIKKCLQENDVIRLVDTSLKVVDQTGLGLQ